MMKKHIIASIIVLVSFIVVLLIKNEIKNSIGKPIDYSVKTPRQKNYIIVEQARTTDYDWALLDKKTLKFKELITIENDDGFVDRYNYDFFMYDNKYYVYGHFSENNELGKVFIAEGWDFKYPISHFYYGFIPLSKKCTFEFELSKYWGDIRFQGNTLGGKVQQFFSLLVCALSEEKGMN